MAEYGVEPCPYEDLRQRWGHIVLSAVGERVAAVNFVDEDDILGMGQHYSVRRGKICGYFFMELADFINGGETN